MNYRFDKNILLLKRFHLYNICIAGKPGKTQTYWLQSETKEGAIRKKPPDASTQLKPLCLSKNIGGMKTLLYHSSTLKLSISYVWYYVTFKLIKFASF